MSPQDHPQPEKEILAPPTVLSPTPSLPTIRLPPEASQLSTLTAIFVPRRLKYITYMTLGGLCCLFGAFYIVNNVIRNFRVTDALGCGSLLILFGTSLAGYSWWTMQLFWIGVYPEGMLYRRGRKVQVFLWHEVRAVWQSVTRFYVNFIYTGTRHVYTVQRRDGAEIILDNRLYNVDALGALIQEEVTRILLPRAIQVIQAGRTLEFGEVIVAQMGVGFREASLPWSNVQSVDVQSGCLVISEKGKWLAWKSIAVEDIPNFFVLIALINRLRSAAGQQEPPA